ncbi:hypothetical protein C8T65DRAFT_643873 [Cerioporus squamosus]|nr:hypothetical protein C8T65DRAFT_643873 [Cerioporus squamosus]
MSFLGSATSLFKDQMSGDIYLQYAWRTLGQLQRVAHVCITYGISAAIVQVGDCPQVGELPDEWVADDASLWLIDIEDEGAELLHLHGAPDEDELPNRHLILHYNAFYDINHEFVAVKHIPWHNRVKLTQTEGSSLHYHEHARRKGHGPPPAILPEDRGKYREFMTLVFSTQVQSCRRTEGVIQRRTRTQARARR